MTPTTTIVVIVAWAAVGLLSGLWMARRGHDPLWILIALPLGPLFVPVALERVQRRPGLATFGAKGAPPRRSGTASGPRVLVGLDGSAHSERALAMLLQLFGSRFGCLVLAQVVHFEAADDDTRAEVDAATQRLAALAADAGIGCTVHTEVLTGAPGPALREFARQQDMDMIAVGRRGQGVSARLLGSVSADLVENSSVPVLVLEPAGASGPRSADEDAARETHPRR
ncbi:universal stress protein [Mycobacterium sp. B14F4]|uniref:universal stress protein n=1 Tax=Mycobacterium sp. B14F4 TaxID=3153565 RepID=UPI00325DE8ED